MNSSGNRSGYSSEEKRFLQITYITICSLFLLILAGGIVRSTGSGMGCPDWPKCFDSWVPPTSESQLPDNYQEKYVTKRIEKNERFVNYLGKLGMTELASRIHNDPEVRKSEPFNVSNTYTEYINRLLGAFTGFMMILTAVAAVPFRKSDPKIFVLSIISLVLVIFQGWLGSIVVSTNLIPWTITLHMILALIILALVIYIYAVVRYKRLEPVKLSVRKLRLASLLIWICLGLTTLQVIWGTEVREMIDSIASGLNYQSRETWIDAVGFEFQLHRSFSIVVFLINVLFTWFIYTKLSNAKELKKFTSIAFTLLILQIVTGIVLSYFAIPPVFQTLHLWIVSLLTGAQVLILILINMYKRTVAIELIS